ncbi:ABC-type branched-chain amino acid transport system, ATPase component [Desulfocapsa sulfexigens DSM 10523]|uniref:ABC-type branched-chain amino acid transport system, ATPase component n=1 Tax=Desulfocapsa sulfexigens (strain DSM 10523 / SB164P1) TaxID=1167006 RepID=M1P8F8_DESSD|nr:ABC transporter ATP-binding protein [Desulfocapsa sulfexigens]AGF79768.1 ABC-type branched-chain amino acid transport system, ATPase component [Desulfocapsa sulfexigens DSM 10523]
MSEAILQVSGLTKNFGGIKAIDKIDLDIHPGEIVALIGPNGAGKTTFFNCLTGIYTPTAGDIYLRNPETGKKTRLNGMKPNNITKIGMARTFQNIRLFPSMSVLENVMIGRHCRTKALILGAIFRGPATRREEEEIVDTSRGLLKKVGLHRQANEEARNLSYGAQRRLEIGRALATEPFLLLLDEPAAGMNPQETEALVTLIKAICKEGHSILLIEHDMKLVMSLSDRIFVMDYGKKIAQGTPEEVRSNPAVIKAYLGEDVDA